MARFQHRFVVVTETAAVVGKPTYRYRSYSRRNDALDNVERVRAGESRHFVRRYIVDTQRDTHVILP